jgi:hypothetical protein
MKVVQPQGRAQIVSTAHPPHGSDQAPPHTVLAALALVFPGIPPMQQFQPPSFLHDACTGHLVSSLGIVVHAQCVFHQYLGVFLHRSDSGLWRFAHGMDESGIGGDLVGLNFCLYSSLIFGWPSPTKPFTLQRSSHLLLHLFLWSSKSP